VPDAVVLLGARRHVQVGRDETIDETLLGLDLALAV
jgi:hypothetical protein